jgi:hypothetical protein
MKTSRLMKQAALAVGLFAGLLMITQCSMQKDQAMTGTKDPGGMAAPMKMEKADKKETMAPQMDASMPMKTDQPMDTMMNKPMPGEKPKMQ